jgi:hypothetical protein
MAVFRAPALPRTCMDCMRGSAVASRIHCRWVPWGRWPWIQWQCPSPLQLAGMTPLMKPAGTLLGGENAPQYNHLGSTLGHTYDSTFVSVECWNKVNKIHFPGIMWIEGLNSIFFVMSYHNSCFIQIYVHDISKIFAFFQRFTFGLLVSYCLPVPAQLDDSFRK